ncbi:type III polyketide synthase [Pseudoclavibacter sp. AY1F1]|nr:type III polyketide synthase [Pseudoclavibacter sp. AY1F1]
MGRERGGLRAESGIATVNSVGTSVPPYSFDQQEVLRILGIEDDKRRALFLRGGIEKRHLVLPSREGAGGAKVESQGELLKKHAEWSLKLASKALLDALSAVGRMPSDVEYLCCVTSTGFMTPGISARLIHSLSMNEKCARLDVVGMGCNAGLNALQAVSNWASLNPDGLAVVLCVEVCSAAYIHDGTMRSAVVNSLFGDGAAAAVVTKTALPGAKTSIKLKKFSSHIDATALDAMRYDWNSEQSVFSFYLDPMVPYVVGANMESALGGLLHDADMTSRDIDHWIIHSGGKKVIDATRVNLSLSRYQLRHTVGVLRDFGNLSSGSFLFSLSRLIQEDSLRPMDSLALVTMGPGATIETALAEVD